MHLNRWHKEKKIFRNSLVEMSMHRHRQHAKKNTRSIAVSVYFIRQKRPFLCDILAIRVYFYRIINNDGDRFNVYNSALYFLWPLLWFFYIYLYFIPLVSFVHMTQYTPIRLNVNAYTYNSSKTQLHLKVYDVDDDDGAFPHEHLPFSISLFFFSLPLCLSLVQTLIHVLLSRFFFFSTCNLLLSNANDKKKIYVPI